MSNQLEVKLVIDKIQDAETPFELRFILSNKGKLPIYILKAYTPLEGLRSDCLDVQRSGESLPYDGPLLKRARATAKSYAMLNPGESVEKLVDISECYTVSTKGTYIVSFKGDIRDVIATEDWKPRSLLRRDTQTSVRPSTKSKTFKVKQTGRGRATSGAIARASREAREKKSKSTRSPQPSVLSAKAPKFVGGTSGRKKQTKRSHYDGYSLCTGALSGLAKNANYKTWFGVYTAARFRTVKSVFTKSKGGFERTVFTYHLDGGSFCMPDTYAYTFFGADEIWLCSEFWNAPQNGTDSKAGIILHEHTHASADTEDYKYGQSDCKALAKNDPDKAIDNADNFEYFAGG